MKIFFIYISLLFSTSVFSSEDRKLCEKLKKHINLLNYERVFGTEKNTKAATYIANIIKKLGLIPSGDKEQSTYFQKFSLGAKKKYSGVNVIGVLEKNGNSKAPEILVMAHFDSVTPHQCKMFYGASSKCKGVADNLSSVASVLSMIPHLKENSKASIGFLFFNAEEVDFFTSKIANGSRFFVNHLPFSMKKVKLIINLDILGGSLSDKLRKNIFILGSETGGAKLKNQIMLASVNKILRPQLFSYVFGHQRSDHSNFRQFKVPILFFTDSENVYYHSSKDSLDNLDLKKVLEGTKLIQELVINVSSKNIKFNYSSPEKLLTIHTPTYKDIFLYIHFIKDALVENAVPIEDIKEANIIIESLKKIYEKGKNNFSIQDKKYFGGVAKSFIERIRTHSILGMDCL